LTQRILAGILSLVGLGVTLFAILTHQFNPVENYNTIEVADIGRGMLSYEAGGFILPFEVISVLLVAVMIGAIVIAKGKRLEQ
jgi:NADH-quinone oxidoreductase subunit J